MPDLRQLRVFVAVAEELNFSRAAERLHLGQQAVSKSVQQLERELGVELLERTTRAVALTAAGAALVESGRPVLAEADAAFERARQVGGAVGGTVRVGVTPAVGPRERQELVRALRDGAPDLVVSVSEVRPGEVERALRDRELDLMLARATPRGSTADSAPLAPTPCEVFVPTGHRLAGRGEVSLADLDGERLLVWNPPGTPYTDLMLDRLRAGGAEVEPVESRVVGDGSLSEVSATGAVALMPAGSPAMDGAVAVGLSEPVTVPLLVLWPAGVSTPAVQRVRAAMSSPVT